MRTPVLAAMLAIAVSTAAYAQDPAPAPAPAPEPTPATPAPAPAPARAAAPVDSVDFSGDWEWAAQVQDRQMNGTFRINRNSETGRYTGVVTRQNSSGNANSPIRSLTVRRRSFTLTTEFDGEIYSFSGTLEGGRAINGSISFRGGMGRLRAERRS